MNTYAKGIVFKGTTRQFLTYIIILTVIFITFCSFSRDSFGMECIILSIVLLILNLSIKSIMEFLPFILISMVTLLLLFFSGQASVRGFNAPINHALKFVNLMFTAAVSIGMRNLPKKYKLSILRVAILSITISVLNSLYNVIIVNKYALRYYAELEFTTVADFDQFYGICFVLCVLICALFLWNKGYKIRKFVPVCIIMSLFVCLSLYVTGLLICMLGVSIAFAIYMYLRNKRRATVSAIVVMLALVIVLVFRNQISDFIYSITEPLNFILRDRLRSVADMVLRTDHNLAYSYDRRNELAGYSLNAFYQHPLFGVGYESYGYGVIGCHQEWQDMLGVFGAIGTSIFISLMIWFIKFVIKNVNNKADIYVFSMAFILFFILGFLDPCLSLPVLFAVFIIAPNISLFCGK